MILLRNTGQRYSDTLKLNFKTNNMNYQNNMKLIQDLNNYIQENGNDPEITAQINVLYAENNCQLLDWMVELRKEYDLLKDQTQALTDENKKLRDKKRFNYLNPFTEHQLENEIKRMDTMTKLDLLNEVLDKEQELTINNARVAIVIYSELLKVAADKITP